MWFFESWIQKVAAILIFQLSRLRVAQIKCAKFLTKHVT